MPETFVSHLRVDKQIVPLLSKSTYQKNFSNAIRELVSNAYDADALTVRITISPNFSKIEIEDDGNGMTREEFEHYCTIAGLKRDIKLSRKYNRKRIGQFGIGFLSVFPFCEFLEVTTTVENSEEVITAKIPARKYFEYKGDEDVGKIPINGSIVYNGALKSKQFTKIALVNPTSLVRQYFSNAKTKERKTTKKWDESLRPCILLIGLTTTKSTSLLIVGGPRQRSKQTIDDGRRKPPKQDSKPVPHRLQHLEEHRA
jgi:hypothetical protein